MFKIMPFTALLISDKARSDSRIPSGGHVFASVDAMIVSYQDGGWLPRAAAGDGLYESGQSYDGGTTT